MSRTQIWWLGVFVVVGLAGCALWLQYHERNTFAATVALICEITCATVWPSRPPAPTGRWRNNLTVHVCNFMLKHVATRDYASKIDSLIRQGLLHSEFGGPYIEKRTECDSDDG